MDTPAPTEVKQPGSALLPVLKALELDFSDKALREIDPTRNNVKSITKTGDKVEIRREEPQCLPLKGDFLNDKLRVNCLELGRDVSFEVDMANRSASKITGVTLTLTIFGEQHKLDVTKVRLGENKEGQKTIFTELKNPIPEPAQRLAGMPPSISVEIPVTKDGGLQAPLLSKVFADAADATGPSIAGLLTADVLREASKVALFVESNPAWVNYVVEPALEEVFKTLWRTVKPPMANMPPAVTVPVKPADATTTTPTPRPMDATLLPNPVKPDAVDPKIGDHVENIKIAGADRKYNIHVPPSYNGKTPMPVVILLHGHAQNGETIAKETKFNQMADKEGFIAIYPDARVWAGREDWRAWDTGNGLVPPGAKADDVAFLRQIIDNAEKDFVVDPKRIFMAGLSNGGMMTFRAAPELSDKIAAIAVVSGAMSGNEPPPKQPMSMLHIHGTEDRIVPYDGLKNVPASLTAIGLPKFKPMKYATDYYVEQNKITNPPLVIQNKDVTERRFLDTKSGIEVSEYTIQGGWHVPDNIDEVTGHIWKFFASHPKATGDVSGTAQPPGEEPFNITARLKEHAKKRGIDGLQVDAGKMISEVPFLKDGAFSPSTTLRNFESQSGVHLSDSVSSFLKSTKTVSKQKAHVDIEMEAPQRITIDDGGTGPLQVKAVKIENTSFNIASQMGSTALTDIQGISFEVRALGNDLDVNVKEIAQKIDGSGQPYYRLKAQNPMGSLSRAILFSDKEIPIEMRLGEHGRTSILNEREIKDATLGVNPVTRGYMDIGTHGHRAFTSPSFGSALNFGKDLGIMGTSSYATYKLTGLTKLGTKGRVGAAVTVGLIVAPAIIHGIERLVE
ncbi:MAG: hypothetical protein K2X93_28825 [Candidatus Obscuribacterales bacterium]|nr:hypothetical protein [Candidatus Obscuribacterales bacterium]